MRASLVSTPFPPIQCCKRAPLARNIKLQADAPLNDKAAQQAFNIELGSRGGRASEVAIYFPSPV